MTFAPDSTSFGVETQRTPYRTIKHLGSWPGLVPTAPETHMLVTIGHQEDKRRNNPTIPWNQFQN